MSARKKSKTYHFHNEWEEEFFFTIHKDKCVCLICSATISLPKKGNLQCHFKAMHAGYDRDFPLNSILRKDQLEKLKSSLKSQQMFFKKVCNKSVSATIASLRVSRILVQHKKPFINGEMIKTAFLEAADSSFQNFKNKSEIADYIKTMQLSRASVTRRVELMASDVRTQLLNDFDKCICFSLQFDESTDNIDMAQLSIFARLVFPDSTAKEEIFKIIPLTERTTGENIYKAFRDQITSENFPIKKLVSITTDGAPSMVGRENGFLAFCRKDTEFPNFINYHCIIHQQALCGKMLNLDDVMEVTIKIINSIRAKALQRRLFKCLLEEVDAQYGDLLLHNEIRWLSKGSILLRFRELLPHIKAFLAERKDKNLMFLQDQEWLRKLALLTDLTTMLNELNLELQGENKLITEMISSVNSFKMKNKNLIYFANLEDQGPYVGGDFEDLASVLENILKQFEMRFTDFNKLSIACSFLTAPFGENLA